MDRIGKFFKWLFIVLGVISAILAVDLIFKRAYGNPEKERCEYNCVVNYCEKFPSNWCKPFPPIGTVLGDCVDACKVHDTETDEEEEEEYCPPEMNKPSKPTKPQEPDPPVVEEPTITNLYLPVYNEHVTLDIPDGAIEIDNKTWYQVQSMDGDIEASATYQYPYDPNPDGFVAQFRPSTTRRVFEDLVWKFEEVEAGIHLANPNEHRIIVNCWHSGYGGGKNFELLGLERVSLDVADEYKFAGDKIMTSFGCRSSNMFAVMVTEGNSEVAPQ